MSHFQDAVLVDEHPREAVADGVLLERRSLLRISAATAVAGLATLSAPGCATTTRKGLEGRKGLESGSLDLEGFLQETYPRAKQFVASGAKQEEAYLMAVGELMARLNTADLTPKQTQTRMKAFAERHESEDTRFEMWVVLFALEPGKGFSHHDHRDYNGLILGVEGEARVHNFDVVGPDPVPPKDTTFQIRQTRDDRIYPGRFSTLGTTRENIHDLVAGPDGATVLDVFTFLNKDANSHFLKVDPKPRDAERGIFDASWA